MIIQRREFITGSVAAVAIALIDTACGSTEPSSNTDARINAVVVPPKTTLLSPGRYKLDLDGSSRDGFIYVPDVAANGAMLPLLVILHGASGAADDWSYLIPTFNSFGIAVIAPDARKNLWDYNFGEFGPDVHYIQKALLYAYDRINVDPARVAIGGFSDGATYALTLGITNGDLFQHIMAFSPSGPIVLERRGTPRIFIAHGTNDQVLPVEDTRNITVPALRNLGYDVLYEEFPGGHAMPDGTASEAFNWWLAASA